MKLLFLALLFSFPVMADDMEFCQEENCHPMDADTALVTFSNGETVSLMELLGNIEQDECARQKKRK